MVVAIPNKDQDTDLDFEYWVEAYMGTPWYEMILTWDFSDVGGGQVLVNFIIVVVVLCCASSCYLINSIAKLFKPTKQI